MPIVPRPRPARSWTALLLGAAALLPAGCKRGQAQGALELELAAIDEQLASGSWLGKQ